MVVYERVAREVEDKWVMSEEVASELRLQVEALMSQNTATQAQLQQQVLLLLVNFAPASTASDLKGHSWHFLGTGEKSIMHSFFALCWLVPRVASTICPG